MRPWNLRMLAAAGLCHPLQLPVTLRPSACLSEKATAFYSVVRWKWETLSLGNCSSVSVSSLTTRKKRESKDVRKHGRPTPPSATASAIILSTSAVYYTCRSSFHSLSSWVKGQPIAIPSGHLTLLNTTKNADDISATQRGL